MENEQIRSDFNCYVKKLKEAGETFKQASDEYFGVTAEDGSLKIHQLGKKYEKAKEDCQMWQRILAEFILENEGNIHFK